MYGLKAGDKMTNDPEADPRITADFTMQNEITIVTLPKVPSGVQFEDDNWLYAFKGESVMVTDKSAGTTVECGAITEPGMALVNVGD